MEKIRYEKYSEMGMETINAFYKGILSFGLKTFAGICNWMEISDEDKTITCGKLESGTIEYGILRETGVEV